MSACLLTPDEMLLRVIRRFGPQQALAVRTEPMPSVRCSDLRGKIGGIVTSFKTVHLQIDKDLLQHTAGPYIGSKVSVARRPSPPSAYDMIADELPRHAIRRVGPTADMGSCRLEDLLGRRKNHPQGGLVPVVHLLDERQRRQMPLCDAQLSANGAFKRNSFVIATSSRLVVER